MTKENDISVPRWFLENVENTLRIQNNINLDRKTEETCQDRNIRQSLNGLRKLLKGEELTGMERLEKLQTPLPSNLDEAAKEIATDILGKDYLSELDEDCAIDAMNDAINLVKAGAEWMAGQGETHEHYVIREVAAHDIGPAIVSYPETFGIGDKVIVQIRKKETK